MTNLDPLPLVTFQAVADHLGVSRQTIYNLVRRGDLKMVKIGRASRITRESLDAYVKKVLA